MNYPELKRIRSLEPFARDHGVGLVCAHKARKAVRASNVDQVELLEQIRSICHNSILGYLEDEQWVLSPLIGNDHMRATFHERQNNIRKLTHALDTLDLSKERGLGLLSMFADALDDYVRWAQHTLFPRIEEGIESDALHHLSKLTSKIEANRVRPTQQLHRSVNARPSERKGGSVVHALLLVALAGCFVKLTMAALQVYSAEWLRMHLRTWENCQRQSRGPELVQMVLPVKGDQSGVGHATDPL